LILQHWEIKININSDEFNLVAEVMRAWWVKDGEPVVSKGTWCEGLQILISGKIGVSYEPLHAVRTL